MTAAELLRHLDEDDCENRTVRQGVRWLKLRIRDGLPLDVKVTRLDGVIIVIADMGAMPGRVARWLWLVVREHRRPLEIAHAGYGFAFHRCFYRAGLAVGEGRTP